MLLFLIYRGNIISLTRRVAEAPDLRAAEASLDILVAENKTAEVFCLYEDWISYKRIAT